MSKVVITAKVHDVVEWEKRFRTIGDLLDSVYRSPIEVGTNTDDNSIWFVAELRDVDRFLEVIDSEEANRAKEEHGVIPGTHRYQILDREVAFP